ncbi:ComEA family DNA-binding protein [Paenibacillus sp. J5C_2022]|uniref:ComEA family DNA-binding protein n=1 Tax=Paenibacillus sp. J5C2022 TaxID=2977129 RepID=UPI0021CF4469|nr:ComEA family DNA-binding protein [Paenibacillus sp. J5C2022]MCU6707636.1 ComEA family DNA-binding protein [Paenibacillus sp. J5C2022]
MRQAKNGSSALLLIAACVMGALLLIAAAVMERKPATEEWFPLNDAVAEALEQLQPQDTAKNEMEKGKQKEMEGYAMQNSGGTASEMPDETVNQDEGMTDRPRSVEEAESEQSIKVQQIGEFTERSGDGRENDKKNYDLAGEGSKDTGQTQDERLNINTASELELQQLKGIGPSKAKAIVEDRELNGPFQSTEDLMRVKGIGERLYAGVKESVVALP